MQSIDEATMAAMPHAEQSWNGVIMMDVRGVTWWILTLRHGHGVHGTYEEKEKVGEALEEALVVIVLLLMMRGVWVVIAQV